MQYFLVIVIILAAFCVLLISILLLSMVVYPVVPTCNFPKENMRGLILVLNGN